MRLVPAVALALAGFVACGDGGGEPSEDAGEVAAVTIDDFSFLPAGLTIEAGQTVRWTNEDGPTHTATADEGNGGEFDSGNISTGDAFEHVFDEPGTYPYHCNIHPSMTGEIVVSG